MIPERVKVIIDLTIGDGYIADRKNASLEITHSIHQTEYAAHKAELLRNYGFKTTEKVYESHSVKNNGKFYHSVYAHVDAEIATARKWVYNSGRKAIDKALLRQIDDRTLAYWYMDDGTTKLSNFIKKGDIRFVYDRPKVSSYVFCTDGFSYEECELFSNFLKEQYSIHNTIIRHSTKNNFWRIYINNVESKDKFKEMVMPYIIPSMSYKFMHEHTLKDVAFTKVDRSQRERLSESTNEN